MMEMVPGWLCSPGQWFSLALCILKATPHHPPLNEICCGFLSNKYWQPGALRGKVSGKADGIAEVMRGSQPVVTAGGFPSKTGVAQAIYANARVCAECLWCISFHFRSPTVALSTLPGSVLEV